MVIFEICVDMFKKTQRRYVVIQVDLRGLHHLTDKTVIQVLFVFNRKNKQPCTAHHYPL